MIKTMADAFDGLAIARRRIAEEAVARTGFLDLGRLGLTALPPELFNLRHLRTLNLGSGIRREDGRHHVAYGLPNRAVRPNEFAAELADLRQLPELLALSVAETPIADLTPLSGIATLRSLDCTYTSVAELTPLSGLATLQEL